jgi:Glyoxalase superfamily protein
LRIFDIAKADEFYQEFLGFVVDCDHRLDPGAPLYRQISRGKPILHLSEHHGDGCPGARIRVMMQGFKEVHGEISDRVSNRALGERSRLASSTPSAISSVSVSRTGT